MYENSFLDPAYITPEEQQILDGNIAVQKNLYTSKQDFVVESDKFLEHSDLLYDLYHLAPSHSFCGFSEA